MDENTKVVALSEKQGLPNMTFTRDQIELIKRTVARGATDDELALFLYQAKRTGLDPLTRQIHFVKRKQRQPDGSIVEVGTIQTGIDGFRVIAERSGKYAGQLGPYWCGKDGQWRDVWLSPDPPVAAKVGILRSDFKEPIWAVARFDAYAQRKSDGKLFENWAKMPDLMLAKCAEALAIRKAFPQDLSGIYAHEEMGQSYIPEQNRIAEPEIIPSENGNDKATEKQRKMIFVLAKKQGISEDEIKAIILTKYGVDSTKELTRVQASELIDKLQNNELEIEEVPEYESDPDLPGA
ncbi:phage recombination protein Bet [Carboxydothermus hydrogenoformans]|uniref:Prophage LambdaCh01, recombination protein Bet n=1 Tax=Carboxydothermus hydrogenoformans (strain ATCC BAA-161 / DSM 6008 / Z-2901) TaxID=246194 RepID=Q3ABH5_CARHZ|nr:phage recombination protein Bet [Carboxydothermus hydrogenoformans]ABB16092.1 prophage LambdaCh01, recombination protein Bet [Carboxydothermus hydrogenoformans Z-2901]